MSDFRNSKTKDNLMRAFAGESQARNRYTMAEEKARQQKIMCLLTCSNSQPIRRKFTQRYSTSISKSCQGRACLLTAVILWIFRRICVPCLVWQTTTSVRNQTTFIPAFAEVARQEGYGRIAQDFTNIAKIENVHGKRFAAFGKLMKEGKLFSSSQSETWVCLNCGYIVEGTQAPERCPVCGEAQGYYIRLSMASWGSNCNMIK